MSAIETVTEQNEENEEYISAGDAARLLRVSARTVSRWADQGRIPHLVTLGGHRRFRKSNVLELLSSVQRPGGSTGSSSD